MEKLDALRDGLPDAAKDLRLNLQTVLSNETLSKDQTWGIALSAAYFLRNHALRDAVVEDAKGEVSEAVFEDAKAAAALMGMNTIYYRFRHLIGKESYAQRPARLRMQRMANVTTNRTDFELFCLACAALAGCETCIKSHEASVLKGGLSEDQVNDCLRITATLSGVAVALEL